MTQYYVVALMETSGASNLCGIGFRSFWLCHSGPYERQGIAAVVANTLTGDYPLMWRGTKYFLRDAMAVRGEELIAYGLDRKRKEYQVLHPGLRVVE